MKKPIKELVVQARLDETADWEDTYSYRFCGGSYVIAGNFTIAKEIVGAVPPRELLVAIRFRKWWQRLWFTNGWCGGKK